jgi:hypothetical protein
MIQYFKGGSVAAPYTMVYKRQKGRQIREEHSMYRASAFSVQLLIALSAALVVTG